METTPAEDPGRRQAVERARREWIAWLAGDPDGGLLDLPDGPEAALDLGETDPEALDRLLAGECLPLSRLHGPERAPAALERARRLEARARALEEEHGLRSLDLVLGLATWDDQPAAPRAPLLLRPLVLAPHGVGWEDCDAWLEEGLRVNEELLDALAARFGVAWDREGIDALLRRGVHDRPGLGELAAAITAQAWAVPGFRVEGRLLGAAALRGRLEAIRDLEGAPLAEDDLIAALAGDPEARRALAARNGEGPRRRPGPDLVDPDQEVLALDADADQTAVVDAVLEGRDLVVHGPAGTGKSQTVANLIAALAAEGRSVLLVAPARAAIETVTERLERVGLGELVIDPHREPAPARTLARRLGRALSGEGEGRRRDRGHDAAAFERAREALRAHAHAIHEPRPPWGVSLQQVRSEALGLAPRAASPVRLRGEHLRRLDPAGLGWTQARLERLAELGGLGAARAARPWARAPIADSASAARALALVRSLEGELLPRARAAMGACLAECGLEEEGRVAAWPDYLLLWQELAGSLARLRPEALGMDLSGLAAALAPALAGGVGRLAAGLLSTEFRGARLRARALVLGDPDDPALAALVAQAAERAARWSALAGPEAAPALPGRWEEAKAAVEPLLPALAELGELLGDPGLADLSAPGLAERLRALAADQGTLAGLPEVRSLRARLGADGLGGLVAELDQGGADAAQAAERLRFVWLASLREELAAADRRSPAAAPGEVERAREEFRRRDRDQVAAAPARLRRRRAERLAGLQRLHGDQVDLLDDQARRRRRGLELPELLARAPEALLAAAPCWALTPRALGATLPPGLRFDVAILDGASRMGLAEVVPALLRARRAVALGDLLGAPPPVREEGPPAPSALEALGDLLEPVVLRHHHRSADERLIAFSDSHLYGSALAAAPGPGERAPLRLAAAGADGGVAAAVRLATEQLAAHPRESLGLVALDPALVEPLERALGAALAERPELEPARGGPEPLFVTGAERVQGRERDAIVLAVGPAPPADGRLLNAAITRARGRLLVVGPPPAAEPGPLLAAFLEHAARGAREPAGPDALDPVEADVRAALERMGVPLAAAVGLGEGRVGLAARHPARPERLVLAIECEGAGGGASVRDRERLRPEALERRGWRVHRVLTGDWLADPQKAAARIHAAWRAAVAASDGEPEPDRPAADEPGPPPAAPPSPAPLGRIEIGGWAARRRSRERPAER